MFGIIEEACMRVVEDTPGFLKPDSVLDPIAPIFSFVPSEPEHV